MIRCKFINHVVNFRSGHSFADVCRNVIQQCGVDFGTFADARQLFFGAQ